MGNLTYTDKNGKTWQTADTPANRAGIPASGGTILSHAGGGWVTGTGTGTSDSIISRLSAGEFVVNAAASAANASLLSAINSGGRISAQSAPVNVAAPIVHVYVDGKEFRGMVRVEIAEGDRSRAMSARRTVTA